MVRDKFHYTMFAASSLVDLEISKFRKLCNLSRILLNTYGNNQTTSRDSRALKHGFIPTLVYQVLEVLLGLLHSKAPMHEYTCVM